MSDTILGASTHKLASSVLVLFDKFSVLLNILNPGQPWEGTSGVYYLGKRQHWFIGHMTVIDQPKLILFSIFPLK